jgi:Uma2 family endonuclease
MNTQSPYAIPLMSADHFLEIDFAKVAKAELDNGAIKIISGVPVRHAWVQGSLLVSVWNRLKDRGLRPLVSDMLIKTHDLSVRRADLAVYPFDLGGKGYGADPVIVFEILFDGESRTNLAVKTEEYCAMPSVQALVFVDAVRETVRTLQRTDDGLWIDAKSEDIVLHKFDLVIPHAEIFSRD